MGAPSPLGAMISAGHAEHADVAARILAAYVSAAGDREATARALGVSWRTLQRWIAWLALHGRMAAAAREHGFQIGQGPPRTLAACPMCVHVLK